MHLGGPQKYPLVRAHAGSRQPELSVPDPSLTVGSNFGFGRGSDQSEAFAMLTRYTILPHRFQNLLLLASLEFGSPYILHDGSKIH